MKEHLKDLGCDFIHGGVDTGSSDDPNTREGKIKKFKNGDIKILVANPAACSEGISLHQHCHNAIFVERSFNLSHYLQSLDRIHRVGMPENIETNIEILICKNTIDENVDLRLKAKKESMDSFFNNKKLSASTFEERDDISYEESLDEDKYTEDFDKEDADIVKDRITRL